MLQQLRPLATLREAHSPHHKNALSGKPLPVYGSGTQIRDWLYVEDHARALHLVLTKGRLGETYDIGGNNEHSNIQTVRRICGLLDELAPRGQNSYIEQITFVEDRPGHDLRYAVDNSKITFELGWRPLESFGSGLRKTVLWTLHAAANHQDKEPSLLADKPIPVLGEGKA